MNFRPELLAKVLSGEKTRTRRIVKPNEVRCIDSVASVVATLPSGKTRLKWREGNTYAAAPVRSRRRAPGNVGTDQRQKHDCCISVAADIRVSESGGKMNQPYDFKPTDNDLLNKRIAERVGWTHVRWGAHFMSDDVRIETFIGVMPGDLYDAEWDELDAMDSVPSYSTSADAALTLNFELSRKDKVTMLSQIIDSKVIFEIMCWRGSDPSARGYAETFVLAYCRCWLNLQDEPETKCTTGKLD